MTATTTGTIPVPLAKFADEAEMLIRYRDQSADLDDPGGYHAYSIAVSVLHRLSGGRVGAAIQDQPGWQEKD